MEYLTQYQEAFKFAEKKHDGQVRIGGAPYITHPISVSEIVKEWGYGIEYQITALFHDLLEDTDASEDEIKRIGGENVLEAVKLLTKSKGYIMEEYVRRIKENPLAKVVKAADRLHNLRCAVVTNDDFKRRYILESIDWYLDLSPEIPAAVKALVESMNNPLTDLPLIYKAIERAELFDNAE